MVWGGGGGERKNGDQIINHCRQCCIHSHTDTHTHTERSSNSKTLFSGVINDDTSICNSKHWSTESNEGGGGGGYKLFYAVVLRCSWRFLLKELSE